MANILLVEDDQMLREINTDVLQSEGYTVTVAMDGEQALSALQTGKWDVILMDVLIPKMDGFAVIEKAKSELHLSMSAPIVFLTNMDEEKDKLRAQELGGSLVIKGNLTPPDLIALVQQKLQTPSSTV